MSKFENKAKELGLDLNDLSKSLKKEVSEYNEGLKELSDLKDQLENASDEEAQSIQDEINELEDVLNDFDVLLVQKIEKYNQNKASYDEKLKKMAEGREKAKLAKQQGQATPPTPIVEPTLEPTPTPIVEPIVDPTPQPTPTSKDEEPKPKEEEKSDWTWLILAGLVGAVTLGAVILRKK